MVVHIFDTAKIWMILLAETTLNVTTKGRIQGVNSQSMLINQNQSAIQRCFSQHQPLLIQLNRACGNLTLM
jgi:hypothetical protein